MGAYAGPDISEQGLVLALDAGNLKSYDKYENLITYSEQFDNAIWSQVGTDGDRVTVVSNQTVSPDGNLTADFVRENVTTNVEHLIKYLYTGTGTHTFSIFVKDNGAGKILIYFRTGVTGVVQSATFFTFSTETLSNTTSASFTKYENGWYRINLQVSTDGWNTIAIRLCRGSDYRYNGDGVSGVYLWGAQLERGSSLTEYYSTTASTKTRTTNWTDLSSNGNNGTLTNGPTYSSADGGSIVFDDVNDFVRFTRTDLNGGTFAYTNITCNLWVNPGSSQNTAASTSNNLITVENTFEISIGNRSNGFSSLFYASVPWAWYGTESDVIKNDTWNMITFVHATTGRWLYVNGTQVFYRGDTGNLTAGSSTYPYLTLMGRFGGTTNNAGGLLSNVQLYNRVLSVNEIQQNYIATKSRFGL